MSYTASERWKDDFSSVKGQVNSHLLAFCRQEAERAIALHPNYGRLWEAISAHIEGGGKRIRPYLAVLSYRAFGGTDHRAIIQAAAAWELIHVAMLMHDDIIDRDYQRHGGPNVAGRYLEYYESIAGVDNRRHFANSSALLAGDLLISEAYQQLLTSSFSPSRVLEASHVLHEAIFTVVGGELLDVEASAIDLEVSPDVVAETKTASYSLIGPLLTGASLAGASDEVKARLRGLGHLLGVGFQYVDDLLGTFGDEAVTGKSVLSDLEEGKRTFVVAEALNVMGEEDRERTERLLRSPSASNVHELRDLIQKTGVEAIMAARIDTLESSAIASIGELALTEKDREAFENVARMVFRRQS